MGKEGNRAHPTQPRCCKKPHHGKKSFLEIVWAAPKITNPSTPYTELNAVQKLERIRAALVMVLGFKKQRTAGTAKKDLEEAGVWDSLCAVAAALISSAYSSRTAAPATPPPLLSLLRSRSRSSSSERAHARPVVVGAAEAAWYIVARASVVGSAGQRRGQHNHTR